MAFFPGMAVFFAVLGFNHPGDGVREALAPPNPRPEPEQRL
jgi:peptide/nickel transport system permease protein